MSLLLTTYHLAPRTALCCFCPLEVVGTWSWPGALVIALECDAAQCFGRCEAGHCLTQGAGLQAPGREEQGEEVERERQSGKRKREKTGTLFSNPLR